MKTCPGCSVWIPDDAAFCPSCGKPTGAAPPTPSVPPGSGSPREPDKSPGTPPPPEPEPTTPSFDRAKAEHRVRTLGTLYIVAGAWTILGEGWQLVMLLTGRALEQAEAIRDEPIVRDNPDLQRYLDLYLDMLREPGVAAIPYFLALGVGAFYVWSGLQLRDLRGRTMAFVAAIVMLVLFLCSSECCGCCFTVPLGVGALFLLTRADTEAVMR